MLKLDGTTGSTSQNLLRRVRANDPDAWHHFAAIYAPLVYHWARLGGLQPTDAQDIVQEVFRTVCGKLDSFQRDGQSSSFRGWLWTITRNRVRLFFRKQNNQAHANGGTTAAQALAEIPELWQRDEEPATGAETQLLVRRALVAVKNDFAEATWQAFWQTAMESKSTTEVAANLGLSPSAVRQAKYRVLCRLREELADF